MIEINTMNRKNFYEIIQSQIANNPDAVNFQDKVLHGNSYISIAAGRGDISKISYLLEHKANIYLLNNDKENVLHEAAVGYINTSNKIREGKLDQYIQIFKILLNYEVEQRAYFPEQYKTPWLKEQNDSTNYTPLDILEKFHYPDKASVINEFKNSMKEAEIYYQKCLENKAKNIPLEPYHRQFLPEIKQEEVLEESAAENIVSKWSDKVLSQGGLHQRRRSKSAEEIENEKQKSMKLRSRSAEIENFDERKPLLSSQHQASNKTSWWIEWVSKLMISDNGKSKNEKTL